MKKKGISLIGFPASGKSTISKELSRLLDIPIIDVDDWMVEHEDRPLNETIDQKGVDYVLALERQCVTTQDLHDKIISTPGSIIYSDLYGTLKADTYIVWLDVSFETLRQRLAPDVDNVRGVIGLKEKGIRGLYDERLPLYREWAEYTVAYDNQTVEQTAAAILALIPEYKISAPKQ